MKVPFVDLRAQHLSMREELMKAVESTLTSCAFILGEDVDAFENEFAEFCSTAYAVGVGNGLEALSLSLRALGAGPGDEVITAANTFVATVLAISRVGATPVLVDVDRDSYLLDVEKVYDAVTPRTRAIIPVHLYGQMVDMDPIKSLAADRGISVIEDAAQAHGATYHGRKAGSIGDVGCFSFYPAKNLGACGDGGAIVTSDGRIDDTVRLLRNYGSRVKYEHIVQGENSRLDTLQAAILRCKLRRLDEWTEGRRQAAKWYKARLADTDVVVPVELSGRKHVYHLFVIRVQDPRALQEYLSGRGVATGFHYPIPIHLLEAYTRMGLGRGAFPVTEELSNSTISLPMYAELTEDQVDTVCDAVRSALGAGVASPVF